MTRADAPSPSSPADGSLTIVGTGYRITGQITPEAESCIRGADKLFHLVADALTRRAIESWNPEAESLFDSYGETRHRLDSYGEMAERILEPARAGKRVCAAFYGHPGVFVNPSHAAIRQARREGLTAQMLPAISAEDCLFADLEVDPAAQGYQSFEATDFLIRGRRFDSGSALVLWQVGGIGVATYDRGKLWSRPGLRVLTDLLLDTYPPDHEVIVYEASAFPIFDPLIERVELAALPQAAVSIHTTLFVPPAKLPPTDAEMASRLGLPASGPSVEAWSLDSSPPPTKPGSLTVVGTGYNVAGQITPETGAAIEQSDRLFYLVTDPATSTYLRQINPSAESLHSFYSEGENGAHASDAMADRIVSEVVRGKRVCAAFSGHPAIYLRPSHVAIRRARQQGHAARMLPAVSFEDALIADLGVDPAVCGRALVEATELVVRPRDFDTSSSLVVLQAGSVGETEFRASTNANQAGVEALCTRLLDSYPADHRVALYELAQLPIIAPRIEWLALRDLPLAEITVRTTLYLPPVDQRSPDPQTLARLQLQLADSGRVEALATTE